MPPPQQQQQQPDGSLDFLWLIVLIVAIVLLTWYFGKAYIASFIYQVKYYEIIAIRYMLLGWDKIAALLYLPTISVDRLNTWMQLIQLKTLPSDIHTLIQINTDVGNYLRFPLMILLLGFAVILYFCSISLKYKIVFSMQRLRDEEKHNWPRILPVADLDLVTKDLDEPPWAMAMSPKNFCKKHGLIREDTKQGKPIAILRAGKAYAVLARQLGPLWTTVEDLPIHTQSLLAIFAAKTDGDDDAANKLMDQIAESTASGKLNFSGARRILAKHINNKYVVKAIQYHAYVYTVMASVLDLARSAGVLATAEFIWLKPLDRKLWYVLNCVGRQTPFAEVAGIFSHWMAENRLKWPLKVPMVDEALKGMQEALEEIIYDPEEENE